jgi:hypothetical protein
MEQVEKILDGIIQQGIVFGILKERDTKDE